MEQENCSNCKLAIFYKFKFLKNLLSAFKSFPAYAARGNRLFPEDLEALVDEIAKLPHIQVDGLMTIAPFVPDPEENRPIFRELRKLSVDISAKKVDNVNMSVLSMGMTNDYQVAIEEGATMVRVGTGIFGVRNYAQV